MSGLNTIKSPSISIHSITCIYGFWYIIRLSYKTDASCITNNLCLVEGLISPDPVLYAENIDIPVKTLSSPRALSFGIIRADVCCHDESRAVKPADFPASPTCPSLWSAAHVSSRVISTPCCAPRGVFSMQALYSTVAPLSVLSLTAVGGNPSEMRSIHARTIRVQQINGSAKNQNLSTGQIAYATRGALILSKV